MPKVYIAAAFRRFSNRSNGEQAYGEILNKDYVDFLEKIEKVFLKFGFDTCLPHRDEGMWGQVYYEPFVISPLCFYHVHTSDLIFALAESGRGVHLELGYAAGLGKKIIMMHEESEEPSTLIYGLPHNLSPWKVPNIGVADAVIVKYTGLENLLNRLESILSLNYKIIDSLNQQKQNKAVIDIGSHTLKLKILSARKGSRPQVVYTDKNSLGIMGDVIEHGLFSQSTIKNVIALIKTWKSKCEELQCQSIVVTGTAAIRKSSNTNSFIIQIKEETGLNLEILSPERELEYVYGGVQATFNPNTSLAVLNLGGGSTQLGIGNSSIPNQKLMFDFGTRELTEKFPWNKPMSENTYRSMKDYVSNRIKETVVYKVENTERLVHTGGELDFLLRCQVPLQLSCFSPVHVAEIPVSVFSQFSEQFSQSDPSEIVKNFRLDSAWAAGAVASNIIALCTAELVGAEVIIPSNLNISDGIVLND